MCQSGAFSQAVQFRVTFGQPASIMQVTIGTGVQFHDRCPNPRCCTNLFRLVADKQRHPTARVTQWRNVLSDPVVITGDIQPAFGRAFLTLFRNDANCVRLVTQRNGLHLFGGGHFEIQRCDQYLHQPFDIGVGNMATVLPQMCGDTVSPGLLGQFGRPQGVRIGAATCVSHGGYVVDVDPKAQFFLWLHILLLLSHFRAETSAPTPG